MNWLIFALLAPALYTVVNYFDKFLVANKVRDHRGMVIFSAITAAIVGTVFWFLTGSPVIAVNDAALVLVSGMFTIWAAALYFEALSVEDASTVIILFQAVPVFVLILSMIFLSEQITLRQALGFFLILITAVVISAETSKLKFSLSKSFWLIMLADLLWAISAIVAKFVINASSFQAILPYESWGIALGGLTLYLLLPSVRKAFQVNWKHISMGTTILLFANESVYVLAKSVNFFAYAIGPVALVNVLGSTQVIMGVIYAIILGKIFPRSFGQKLTWRDYVIKFVAALVIMLGVWLVA